MNTTIVSSREARAKWRDILDEVNSGLTDVVVERYGKPVAAIIAYEDFAAILEELEDLRDGRLAMAELAAWEQDPSSAQSWETIKAEMQEEGLLDE